MTLENMIIPGIMCMVLVVALYNNVDIFGVFIKGAREGFSTAVDVLPALVALMTCVGMFQASGALDILSHAMEPVAQMLKLPAEVLPLAVLRPVSGSGALVIYEGVLAQFGPDSYIGRVASVMMGSSETTFYTIAVYFGAIQVSRTRHALPASLMADLVGFLMSAWMVRVIFGG